MIAHGVTSVSGIVSYPEHVVVRFGSDKKSLIFGHVDDAVRPRLNVTLQLVTCFLRKLVEQFVTDPVVTTRVVESDFKLRPRTVEEVGSVNALLDQQWDAVGCETTDHN